MTPETWLLIVQQAVLLLNWPVAFILIRAARRPPKIMALNVMAAGAFAIALSITAYQLAVANVAAGYPVPQDVARTVLRLVLLVLEVLPVGFLWIYMTGRFKDGEHE